MKPAYPAHLRFPFHIASDGRAARTDGIEGHVRDELVQLIVTNPGERPFMPEFGGGARRLIFENLDDARTALIRAHMTDAITTWLGHRVKLDQLEVRREDSTLEVSVSYRIHGHEEQRVLKFQKSLI